MLDECLESVAKLSEHLGLTTTVAKVPVEGEQAASVGLEADGARRIWSGAISVIRTIVLSGM
jgi:hypothetical protein